MNLKTKIGGVLILSLLPYFVMAAPDQFPPGQYELDLGARPSAPYNQLQNYNTALTQQGSGTDYTVPASRHHIIPYNRLRDFYNRMLEQGDMLRFRSFFLSLSDNIPHYASAAGLDCGAKGDNFVEAMNLASALAENYARPGGVLPPPGLDDFQQFYAWLPGNLFIGPSNRSDDPGEYFETNANYIIGDDAARNLNLAYTAMGRYIAGESGILGQIAQRLTQVSLRRSVYPLNSSDWIRQKNGKYEINTSRQNELRSKSAMTMESDDKCPIQANFSEFRNKYYLALGII